MIRKLTSEQVENIKRLYPDHSTDELAEMFGITKGYVYALAHSGGVQKNREFFSRTLSNSRRKITDADLEQISRLYPYTPSRDIAIRFGVSVSTINGLSNKHGWKKDPIFKLETARSLGHSLQDVGKQHRFVKGHSPANKGKSIDEFMGPEQEARFRANSFRKGHMPKNHLPVGAEVVMAKDGYVKVKVGEPNRWELKHRLVWIQHHGPIPGGFNIQFRNGDKQDCSIGNLYIISKRQQMKEQNSMYARFPKEIQDNIRSIGYLTRIINKTKKQENDKE